MTGFAGTGTMLRLTLRRERGIAPWWILALVSLALIMVSYIERNMGSTKLLAQYVSVINDNSFFRSLGGGFVVADPGYMAAWRSGGFLYVLNGLAAALAVIRHTRADEETGRTELLRSGPLSRFAPLTAALLVAGGVSLAGGAVPALALIAIGLDAAGSLAYGAAIAAAGIGFAAVGAVAAQLTRSARAARGIALAVLGASYVMRYAGDASGTYWLKYLSPIGWSHVVAPYWNDRLWVLAVPVTVAAVLTAVAYRLGDRRDFGGGLVPESSGPAAATGGPLTLSWRIHRGLLLAWTAGIAVFAAAAGAVSTLADQLANAPGSQTDRLVSAFGGRPGADVVDNGLWAIILIFAHVIALYPVLMVQRLRAEETSGRADGVLATTHTRLRWASGQLALAGLGTAVLLAVAGLILGGCYAWLASGSAADVGRILGGILTAVPAAWLVGAICLLFYGLTPRVVVAASWLVWVAVALLGRVAGPLYGQWGGTPFEPFGYLPNTVAGAAFDPVPVVVMLALTALFAGGGLYALRRRDFG